MPIKKHMSIFKKNIKATTIRGIWTKSDVNTGSFYDYFSCKEDIVLMIIQEMHSNSQNTRTQDVYFEEKELGLNPIVEYMKAVLLDS